MKHYLFTILFILSVVPLYADYSVTGGSGTPLLAEDNRNNHLQIYLLDGMADARITYTSSGQEAHQWYKYNRSANEATAIPCIQSGSSSYITDVENGYGYFVGSPTVPSTEYVWIIDYSLYLPKFYRISVIEDEDVCLYLKILADVEAEDLTYVTPRGAPMNLDRQYQLIYKTLTWDESLRMFIPEEINMNLSGTVYEILLEKPPLQNTDFTLKGDSYAEHFGKGLTIRTPVYEAVAVEAHGFAETDKEPSDNELKGDSTSAPVNYTFTAYANEPVAARYTWKVTYSINGREPEMKLFYTDKVLRYTFTEEGEYKVSLEVIDSKTVCTDTSYVFPITIGKTEIQIPNFFSPGSSIGTNDELKIAYKSLLSFKASVYNRWGNLLYQWTDPTKGWDGRVNGKFVPTGAYVVIVEYTNSAGKKQSKSKTVNILRGRN